MSGRCAAHREPEAEARRQAVGAAFYVPGAPLAQPAVQRSEWPVLKMARALIRRLLQQGDTLVLENAGQRVGALAGC